MNKSNIVLSLFFTMIFSAINTYAKITVVVRNEYKKPIILNVNGYDIRELYTRLC